MRILYICRLFSGFEDSLTQKHWNPKGAPTIARMIETLDQDADIDARFVLTAKDYNSSWQAPQDEIIECEGIKSPLHVLAGRKSAGSLGEKLRDIRHALRLWSHYRRFKPDLIFCDRVNIFPAAIFARFCKTPVIWRVMGVLDHMHETSHSGSLRARFIRFLWRSPFAAVICTLDGSGGGPWMQRVLHPQTQTHMLVNGYEATKDPKQSSLPQDKAFNILVAGRIEHLKGLDVILNTAEALSARKINDMRFIMAGYGGAENWIKEEVAARKLEHLFHFTGALSASEMAGIRTQVDLSLSCGTHGNMTNTVIESLSDGLCMVLPAANTNTGIDADTHNFIPKNAAYIYGEQKDHGALTEALIFLKDNDDNRGAIARAGEKFAAKTIESWNQRIKSEIIIYKQCVE